MSGMLFDGVRLSTRTAEGGYGDLIRRVKAIADAYQVPASQTLASLYVDDKNEALYEVDLAEDIPPGWDLTFAQEIRDLFRELGGYNGLIIRRLGEEMLRDDPWWPDEPLAPVNDNDR